MKSYSGCWTCRVRKKRCDESQPTCGNCSTLQIYCHFGEKPSWMDGGVKQKQKAEDFKRETRNAASRRRGIAPAELSASDVAISNNGAGLTTSLPHVPMSSQDGHSPCYDGGVPTSSNNTQRNLWNRSSTSSFGDESTHNNELDRRIMMFYFDHFFPFLFPFYKPSLIEGGRSWIMEIVVGNEAAWHVTLCLSTYFVSVVLDGEISGHHVCKKLAWDRLLEQMRITFGTLYSNLQDITSIDSQHSLSRISRIMGSIIQLQRFETTIGNFENCQKHLEAAITLFKQIFEATDNLSKSSEPPTMYTVLSNMGPPLWNIRSQPHGAWNSEQAAFRFYSALLLADDIVASTCTEEPPQLLRYHARLLFNTHGCDLRPPIELENFIGCENWILLKIGETAALGAWKKAASEAGQLDMTELVARASSIRQVTLSNLSRINAATAMRTDSPGLSGLFNGQQSGMQRGYTLYVSRIWAHATLLYLSTIVSGWQPRSVGIREHMVETLALFEQMPEPQLLRAMIWPYCVVGCLAEPEEENRLRSIANALAPHRLFGPVRKALEIMENVWQHRREMTVDTSFAICVRSLGHMPLLV